MLPEPRPPPPGDPESSGTQRRRRERTRLETGARRPPRGRRSRAAASVSPGRLPAVALTKKSPPAALLWPDADDHVYRRRGSNASRTALPKRLAASTVRKIITPGKMTSQGEW